MEMILIWTGATVLLAALLSGVAKAVVPVRPDKENVVASRLEGTWRLHTDLTKRLYGRSFDEVSTLSFRSSSAKSIELPQDFAKFIEGKTIFLAGTFTGDGKEYPFLLTEYRGNPHIFYFKERDGDPMGDSESFNVMLAVAKDKQKDLLFIGGDFNNQPFVAFERVE
jgi:hypothetical protein